MNILRTLLSSHLWSAVSVVFTALIAPIVVDFAKKKIADNSLYSVRPDRAAALIGVWRGKAFDRDDTTRNFDVKMTLQYKKPKITGKGELRFQDDKIQELEFEGSFHNNKFIQLSYKNLAVARVQLGVALFFLSDEGTELEGIFAGYSPTRRRLVSGVLTTAKETVG